jgi:metallo-beta-lactamase class B
MHYIKIAAEKCLLIFIILFQASRFGQAQTETPHIRISDDVELIQITENAYVHVSWLSIPKYGRYPANGLLYINKEEAFLFDTPWNDSLTAELYVWVTDSMHKKIVGFVPNHWHEDCMGGLGFLQKHNIKSYANQMTRDIAKSKGLPVPDYGFMDSVQLQLGDQLIELFYLGSAHSTDNCVVWIPSEKILFPGCMVKSILTSNLGNTADGDLEEYPKTIEKLLNKFPDAQYVIPGHGAVGGIELITHSLDLSTIGR